MARQIDQDSFLSGGNAAFVAEFLGEVNRIKATVQDGQAETPLGAIQAGDYSDGEQVDILIRPEALSLSQNLVDNADTNTARVMASRILGRSSLIHLSMIKPDGGELHLHARVPGRILLPENSMVRIAFDASQAFVFGSSS